MSSQWDVWSRLLAGEKLDVQANNPQWGFWRHQKLGADGKRHYDPVLICSDERGGIICSVGAVNEDSSLKRENTFGREKAEQLWPWCAAISEKVYRDVAQYGKPWPDLDPVVAAQTAPGVGHNRAPEDPAVVLREQIEAARAGIGEYAEIKDDATCARAQSLRSRLLELSREADKVRETRKKPHIEAGKAIDAELMPLVKEAKAGADALGRSMSVFETAKLRREREAQEAARRAEQDARDRDITLAEAADKGVRVPELVAPTPIKGAYGRAATVKLVKVAKVIDQDKAYAALREHPEIIDLIAKLAQRAVNAGHEIAGVEINEERKVA